MTKKGTPVRSRRFRQIVLGAVTGLLLVCLGAIAFSALANRGLPTRSQFTERLSEAEKARLAEALPRP